MKKHLLGICVALFIFCGLFYVMPINFGTAKVGSFVMPDATDCISYAYNSNHLQKVSFISCGYKTNELATENFYKSVSEGFRINKNLKLIEQVEENKTKKRAIVGFPFENKPSYRLIRKDGNQVTSVISNSLRHVKEFEQQKFVKFNEEE
jgi:hypothetical protein